MNLMHEIDYEIHGDAMQFVEIELDPMEAAVAEAGGMMYMQDGIEMETIFGDGSHAAAQGDVTDGDHVFSCSTPKSISSYRPTRLSLNLAHKSALSQYMGIFVRRPLFETR